MQSGLSNPAEHGNTFMVKGRITMEDAQIVHDFARLVRPVLHSHDMNKLAGTADTVARIAYCCLAEARQNARAERARHGFIE